MRAQDDSTFSDSEYGEGLGGPTESFVSVDADSEAPQNEQKYPLEALAPLPNKEVPDSQTRTLADTQPVVPGVMRSRARGAVGLIWRFLLPTLVAYLLLIVTTGNVPEALSEVPCKLPALTRHFPHCTPEPQIPEVQLVEVQPVEVQPPPPEEPISIVTPDFAALVQMQSQLGQVMDDTAGSSKVAVDVKDSEMSLRDLRTRVAHSTLSNKDILGQDLKRFVQDAKATSENLQQFGSRVWGAVDRVVSLNEHTLITLENAPTERGLVKAHEKRLESIWHQGIQLLDHTLRKLIHEAQDNVGTLQRLEERLNNIEDMVSTEQHDIDSQESELKRQWFRETLGLNAEQRQSNSASLGLLTVVKDDRKRALKHVTGALLKLKQMSNDLDDFREKVATPMVTISSSHIPVEKHTKRNGPIN
ncbi:transmembrane protein, putative, partial [Rhizoctonia solani AG-3 Rhs1AP]